MSITSTTCTLLYLKSMWPDHHFHNTPPHFARSPGDAAKCFSLAERRGMGALATMLSAAQEPGSLTSWWPSGSSGWYGWLCLNAIAAWLCENGMVALGSLKVIEMGLQGHDVASGTRAPQSQLQTRNSKTTWPWEHITWPYMWLITWPLRHSYITWLISMWPWEPMTLWPWEDITWPIKELVINNVTWQDALWTCI